MSYMDELNFWLNDDYFDQKTIMKQKWKIVFTRNWNSVPVAYVV